VMPANVGVPGQFRPISHVRCEILFPCLIDNLATPMG
jgi:hypothetical protein